MMGCRAAGHRCILIATQTGRLGPWMGGLGVAVGVLAEATGARYVGTVMTHSLAAHRS